MTAPIEIGSTRQLFLDDRVIDATEGVVRQFHRPTRWEGNPVVQADRLWERGGGGVYLFGGAVMYDEEDGLFKMWYRTSLPLAVSTGRARREPEGVYKACYAVSSDGVHWQKPALGRTEFDGSRDNNLLPPSTEGMKQIRRPNLIKDYDDPDPERRYKMLYMDNFKGKWALSKGYSRDGITWRMNVGTPRVFEPPVAPNGILFGWDPRRQEYVHYHRKSGTALADVDGRRVRKKYAVMRTSSADFETWGNTEEAMTASETDPPNWSPSHGVDLAGILYTDDLYVGAVDTVSAYHVEDSSPEQWERFYANEYAEYRTELVISRDGRTWRRAVLGIHAARNVGRLGQRSHRPDEAHSLQRRPAHLLLRQQRAHGIERARPPVDGRSKHRPQWPMDGARHRPRKTEAGRIRLHGRIRGRRRVDHQACSLRRPTPRGQRPRPRRAVPRTILPLRALRHVRRLDLGRNRKTHRSLLLRSL